MSALKHLIRSNLSELAGAVLWTVWGLGDLVCAVAGVLLIPVVVVLYALSPKMRELVRDHQRGPKL